MRDGDRRLLVAALCGISVALATALLASQPHGSLAGWSHDLARDYWPHLRHQLRHLMARKNYATAIQAIGALIAFYGLGRAYIRAKYDINIREWAKHGVARIWNKLLHRPQQVTVHTGTAHGTFGWHAVAVGLVLHNVDITLPLQEQIKRLAVYANNKARQAAEIEKKVAGLQQELEKVKGGSAQLKREVLAHIETQIKELNRKLDRIQVLDLRWAIWGLFVSFVGTVLSFGT